MDGTQHCHPSSNSNLSDLASWDSGALSTQGQIIVVPFCLRTWKPLNHCMEGLSKNIEDRTVRQRMTLERVSQQPSSSSGRLVTLLDFSFSAWLRFMQG